MESSAFKNPYNYNKNKAKIKLAYFRKLYYYHIAVLGSARKYRGVAQVVECLLREQEAVGSSPATPTRFSERAHDSYIGV